MKLDDKFVEVTREEYLAFLKNYPTKLTFDCAGMCEPPMGSHNDFSNGKVWPESMVTKEVRHWLGQNNEVDHSTPGKFWQYFVLKPILKDG